MNRRSFFFSCGVSFVSLSNGAWALAPERCDPYEPGLFRNIGCFAEWRERLERRRQELELLRAEYRRLLERNVRLRRRVRAARRMLGNAMARAREARERVRRYEEVALTKDNIEAQMLTLRQELLTLKAAVDAAKDVKTQCVTREEIVKRERLKSSSTVLEYAVRGITGFLANLGIDAVADRLKKARNWRVKIFGYVLDIGAKVIDFGTHIANYIWGDPRNRRETEVIRRQVTECL